MTAQIQVCVRCIVKPAESECCSSHQAPLCHKCYRLTHFVEVCGCSKCEAEGLPRLLGERDRWKRPSRLVALILRAVRS